MKVYSQSQGQFIDTPDAGASPAQTGNAAFANAAPNILPVDNANTTSLGVPDNTMRNLFFQLGISNPKSVNTLKDLYSFIAPQPPTAAETKKQNAQDSLDKAKQLTQNSIGNILTQYSQLSGIEKQPGIGKLMALNPFSQAYTYNQQRKGLYAALKDVAGAGTGSGVRINNYDIQLWANLMPEPGDTQAQVKTKVQSLNKQLTAKFGSGLDPEYLQAFGVQSSGSPTGSSSPWEVVK
jgi:hypothetical protein